MRSIVTSKKFRKDFRRCERRGYNLAKFEAVSNLLIADESLPFTCHPHKLSGDYAGYWECHIAPDWLLIYLPDDEENTIRYERTGTHADLFE